MNKYRQVISLKNSKINAQAEMYGYRVGTAFDLLAGWTCPAANLCQSFATQDEKTGKLHIEMGENAQFLCYAAKIEVLYKAVYEKHKANFEFTKSPEFVPELKRQIWQSGTSLHRWHAFGDFYNETYFRKCLEVVKLMPEVYFFAYTKQATFMNWYLKSENKLPNMDMVYSMGGLHDKYALKNNLPSCTVITDKKYKTAEITDEGLPIACRKDNKYDDLVYIQKQQSFGIFLH